MAEEKKEFKEFQITSERVEGFFQKGKFVSFDKILHRYVIVDGNKYLVLDGVPTGILIKKMFAYQNQYGSVRYLDIPEGTEPLMVKFAMALIADYAVQQNRKQNH